MPLNLSFQISFRRFLTSSHSRKKGLNCPIVHAAQSSKEEKYENKRQKAMIQFEWQVTAASLWSKSEKMRQPLRVRLISWFSRTEWTECIMGLTLAEFLDAMWHITTYRQLLVKKYSTCFLLYQPLQAFNKVRVKKRWIKAGTCQWFQSEKASLDFLHSPATRTPCFWSEMCVAS